MSITWADPQIYNGNPHAASSSVSGVGSPAENLGSAALTYYAGSTASGAPLAGAPVAAGTYTVNASFSRERQLQPCLGDEDDHHRQGGTGREGGR